MRDFLAQLDPLAGHSNAGGVESREVEKLADEAVELVGIGGRAIEQLTPAVVGQRLPVLQHRVDEPLHGRQRRAQLVRDEREELSFLAIESGELLRRLALLVVRPSPDGDRRRPIGERVEERKVVDGDRPRPAVRSREDTDHLMTQPERHERQRPATEAPENLRPRARPAAEAGVGAEVVHDEWPAP